MHIEWRRVTWYSKLIAIIVFLGSIYFAYQLGVNTGATTQSIADSKNLISGLRIPNDSRSQLTSSTPASIGTQDQSTGDHLSTLNETFEVLGYPQYNNQGTPQLVSMTVTTAEVTDDYTHIEAPSAADVAMQATAEYGRFKKKASETYVIVNGIITNDTFDDLFVAPEDWLRIIDTSNGETYSPRVWYAPQLAKQKSYVHWSNGRSSVVFVVPRGDMLLLEMINSDRVTSTDALDSG